MELDVEPTISSTTIPSDPELTRLRDAYRAARQRAQDARRHAFVAHALATAAATMAGQAIDPDQMIGDAQAAYHARQTARVSMREAAQRAREAAQDAAAASLVMHHAYQRLADAERQAQMVWALVASTREADLVRERTL